MEGIGGTKGWYSPAVENGDGGGGSPGVTFCRRGGSRAKPRVAHGSARLVHSLVLARSLTPLSAGRGCFHGYGARALTLTNG